MHDRAYYQKIVKMGKPVFRFYQPETKYLGGNKYNSLEDLCKDNHVRSDCHVLEMWPAEKVHACYGDDVKE